MSEGVGERGGMQHTEQRSMLAIPNRPLFHLFIFNDYPTFWGKEQII